MTDVVKLDIAAMAERFKFLGKNLVPSVYVAMLVSGKRMIRDVITQRLSGPRGAPGILGVVTGGARRSMIDITRFQEGTIATAIATGLGYVEVHDKGYSGPQSVRAHIRRRLGAIKAVSIAQATRGQVTKRGAVTRAQKAKGDIQVKAHTRKVDIIAKHFVRDTILAAKLPTEARIRNAFLIAAKTGRVPTTGQLGG